jgi:uncharacterized protein (DUF736 family)
MSTVKQKSIRLTGLWEQTDEQGNKYLSAKVGVNYFTVRKNDFKKSNKEPEYYLYISQPNFNKTDDDKENSEFI